MLLDYMTVFSFYERYVMSVIFSSTLVNMTLASTEQYLLY